MTHSMDPADRFWPKVDRSGGPDACWTWLANVTWDGYGLFSLPRGGTQKTVRPHRVAYEALVGPIPDGLELDHLCRNRLCCNPAHLEPVTGRENKLRGIGFAATNAKKTACLRGHPLTGANLYLHAGRRGCRTCRSAATRKARAA